jgi:hypothetical protein
VARRSIPGSLKNQWEVAIEVWDRFHAEYGWVRAAVHNDPIEGGVWIDRRGKDVVEVRGLDWYGHFHLREPQPDALTLDL